MAGGFDDIMQSVKRRQDRLRRSIGGPQEPLSVPPPPPSPEADIAQQEPVVLTGDQDGLKGALSRALQGFSRGFKAVPQRGEANPWVSGAAHGLAASGDMLADEDARRLKARSAQDAVRQKLALSGAEEGMRQRNRLSLERERQSGRLDLDTKRNAAARTRSLQDAAKRANELGASVSDIAKLYDEADEDLMYQGLFPGVPGYEAARKQAVNALAAEYKRLGASRLRAGDGGGNKPDPANPAGLRPPKVR